MRHLLTTLSEMFQNGWTYEVDSSRTLMPGTLILSGPGTTESYCILTAVCWYHAGITHPPRGWREAAAAIGINKVLAFFIITANDSYIWFWSLPLRWLLLWKMRAGTKRSRGAFRQHA